ncbi:MAG: Hpt domain-containing protein [Gammaproteobacteria bacterium]
MTDQTLRDDTNGHPRPVTPVIDHVTTHELFSMAGDRAARASLVTRFAAEATSLLDTAQTASVVHDEHSACAALHQLKGAAGAIGGIALMHAVQRVEQSPHRIPQQHAALQRLIVETCEALRHAGALDPSSMHSDD